jgi:hypothetical protein
MAGSLLHCTVAGVHCKTSARTDALSWKGLGRRFHDAQCASEASHPVPLRCLQAGVHWADARYRVSAAGLLLATFKVPTWCDCDCDCDCDCNCDCDRDCDPTWCGCDQCCHSHGMPYGHLVATGGEQPSFSRLPPVPPKKRVSRGRLVLGISLGIFLGGLVRFWGDLEQFWYTINISDICMHNVLILTQIEYLCELQGLRCRGSHLGVVICAAFDEPEATRAHSDVRNRSTLTKNGRKVAADFQRKTAQYGPRGRIRPRMATLAVNGVSRCSSLGQQPASRAPSTGSMWTPLLVRCRNTPPAALTAVNRYRRAVAPAR